MTARPPLLSRLLAPILVALAAVACGPEYAYQEMSADEIWTLAQAAYEEEEWDRAVEAVERLLALHPGFDRIPEAGLLLARAFFQDEEYITAAAEFARVIERYPATAQAREAALGICRSYVRLSPIPERDQEYTERAVQSCDNVATDHAGTPEAEEAAVLRDGMVEKLATKVYLNGEFYLRRDFYDSAIIYFEDLVENYPETSVAPRALMRLMEIYAEIGYEEEREEARETLLDRYPDSPQAREVREETGGEGEGTADNGEGGGGASP